MKCRETARRVVGYRRPSMRLTATFTVVQVHRYLHYVKSYFKRTKHRIKTDTRFERSPFRSEVACNDPRVSPQRMSAPGDVPGTPVGRSSRSSAKIIKIN